MIADSVRVTSVTIANSVGDSYKYVNVSYNVSYNIIFVRTMTDFSHSKYLVGSVIIIMIITDPIECSSNYNFITYALTLVETKFLNTKARKTGILWIPLERSLFDLTWAIQALNNLLP